MKIATWNVNSVKARLPNILEWLVEAAPDAVLLQEIKCVDEAFPNMEIEDLGYNIEVHGQKSYNGVALLSKRPIEDVSCGLPGDDGDDQARYLEATVDGVRVASIYLPNGNPIDSGKFHYKLSWMDRLTAHSAKMLDYEMPVVLAGDYNVIPQDEDAHDPADYVNDALYQIETRMRFRSLLNLGYTDAYRIHNTEPHCFSYWDYTGGSWQKDEGIRIDHLLVSPQAADRVTGSGIDKRPRGRTRPSDHTPVWIELRE